MICYHNNDNRDTGRHGIMRHAGSLSGGGTNSDGMSALSGSVVFGSLPDGVKRRTARNLAWQQFSEGSVMLSKDGDVERVFLLVSGTALVVNHEHAERRVVRGALGPGDVFGELAALDPNMRSSAIIAQTDCVTGVISADEFRSLVTAHQQPALALMQRLTGALRAANENVENVSLKSARQRLAFELVRLAELDPGDTACRRIRRVPAQSQIAETIGVARQTVAKLFGELIRAGVIERSANSLILHDTETLEKIYEN